MNIRVATLMAALVVLGLTACDKPATPSASPVSSAPVVQASTSPSPTSSKSADNDADIKAPVTAKEFTDIGYAQTSFPSGKQSLDGRWENHSSTGTPWILVEQGHITTAGYEVDGRTLSCLLAMPRYRLNPARAMLMTTPASKDANVRKLRKGQSVSLNLTVDGAMVGVITCTSK